MARYVARRLGGLLKPRESFFEVPQLNQIRANIVVGIAEFRIDFDGALTLGDGFIEFALKMIGPAQKRMRLGGGMQLQRGLIQLHGALVVAFHLGLVRILQNFPSARPGFAAHHCDFLHTLTPPSKVRKSPACEGATSPRYRAPRAIPP